MTALAASTGTVSEWGQSLADGAPGIALPHIEGARAGTAGWEPVHQLAAAMTREPVHAHPEISNLFRGAPAVAYALHLAGHPAYRSALATLDHSIDNLVHQRLEAAHRRVDAGQVPTTGEYDLINGMTGLGVYLLHRHGDHPLLRDALSYLVRLTHPVHLDSGEVLPGWWAAGSPDRRQSSRWDGGHAGFGMAHGIAGPLALLSTAMLRGVTVTGHTDAINIIGAWFDRWQTGHGRHAHWPEVIDRHELITATVTGTGPHRPSWCYGTPGITRALQLAGHAVGDERRADAAEHALVGCLTDERQLALLTDLGLCHGWAGLTHTARRAAIDATHHALTEAAQAATEGMRRHLRDNDPPTDDGFLEGTAGVRLVDKTTDGPPLPRWDTCLLVM